MTEETKTSRPELMVAGAAVAVVVAAAGWFVLGGSGADDADDFDAPAVVASKASESTDVTVSASSGESVATLLNKARMATSADMLAEPAGQNALYFYSLALEADPENAEVQTELSEVSTNVAAEIRTTIKSSNFARASELVQRLEIADPTSTVIPEYYDTVANERASLSDRALQAAQAGQRKQVDTIVANLAALPGTDAATLKALSGRLRSAQSARDAERREVAKAEELAKAEAEAEAATLASAENSEKPVVDAVVVADAAPDWPVAIAQIDEQIAAGDLLGEVGAGVEIAALVERFPTVTEVSDLKLRWIAAVAAKVQRDLSFEQLDDASAGIAALDAQGGNTEAASLRETLALANARIAARVPINASSLTAIEIVPPVYPRAAKRKNLEGWVIVEFTVNPEGLVENIEVVETSESDVFNRSTIQAVSQWQFEPQTFKGQAISQRVATRLAFEFT